MPFDLGDTVRLTAQSTDPGGTLTDAATVTLTITLPDGTTTSPAVTNPPATTGQYTYDYVTEQPGRHAVRWVFGTPDSAYTDVFDVRAADPPLILSLADAKTHLQLTGTSQDAQLRDWLEAITESVEAYTGVGPRRTVTEDHEIPSSGTRALALRRTPVLSITSAAGILTGGTSYQAADLDVSSSTGIVRPLNGGRLYGPLRITYVAGREQIPASLTAAARIILQHLWRTQRAGPRGPVIGGGDDYSVTEPAPGFGYAIPNRALQLMEPYRLPPEVA